MEQDEYDDAMDALHKTFERLRQVRVLVTADAAAILSARQAQRERDVKLLNDDWKLGSADWLKKQPL